MTAVTNAAQHTPGHSPKAIAFQTLVGVGIVVIGLLLVWGATGISSEAGYGGIGPNFLPMFSSAAFAVCGVWIVWEARTGGYRQMEAAADDAPAPYWPGFVWVAAGMLANALFMDRLGFPISCAICYFLAVQGLRRASQQAAANQPTTWLKDAVAGLVLSAPVFWLFTKFLSIHLPGLTNSGWI